MRSTRRLEPLNGETRQYYYMVTVRKHQVKDFVTVQHLDTILDLAIKGLNATVEHVVYEIETTFNQLHLHCIVKTKFRVCYRARCKLSGFRIYWKPVFSMEGCVSYIHKDVCNKYDQEQIVILNHYNNKYMFN